MGADALLRMRNGNLASKKVCGDGGGLTNCCAKCGGESAGQTLLWRLWELALGRERHRILTLLSLRDPKAHAYCSEKILDLLTLLFDAASKAI